MFDSAGLDGSSISNRNLRATGVSRMYSKGIPEKLIMERSGHLSTSGVRSYERTTDEQRKNVSDMLSGGTSSHNALIVDDEVKDDNALKVDDEVKDDNALKVDDEVKDDNALKVDSNDKEVVAIDNASNKENVSQANRLLKHFTFEKMDGCTINFHFS
jgi:phosphopantothenoylcysteine synthetase/decarboxylase